MAIFKSLLAATALVNVAFVGTAYSSDVASVVTSIQIVTSVTYVAPPAASSSTHCNTLTVTEVVPPSTVTVTAPPPGVSGTNTVSSSESVDVTIQTSTRSSTVSKVFGTEPCTYVTSGKAIIATGCHMPSTSSSNNSKVWSTEICATSIDIVTRNGEVLTVTGCHGHSGLLPVSSHPVRRKNLQAVS